MPVFAYTAFDAAGHPTEGQVTAGGADAALDQVLAKGLHPVKIEPAGGRRWQGLGLGSLVPRSRISSSAAESFTRELGNLLAAGVPLSRGLQIVGREASSPAARQAWTTLRDEVVGGASLAEAMERFPQAFSAVNVAMVRAGEQGGFLHVVLAQIADFRSRERELLSRIKAAMVYPIILLLLMAGVLLFLMTYFIPKFRIIFDDFGAALPTLTQVIIAMSTMVREYGLVLVVVLAAAVILVRRLLTTDAGRRRLENVTLATPGIGTAAARFALVRFTGMLGTLLGAGVPLISALRTARDALGNQTLYDAVNRAIEQVQQGESLAHSLATCPRLFPASVVEIIAIAEETGRLDAECLRMATTYEADLDRRLRMLVSMLEPLLLLIMAAVVGTIVVGMLLPVFTLQDLIQ